MTIDSSTNRTLGLEVKRHASIETDLRIDQASFKNPELALPNSFGQRGNSDNIVSQLIVLLDNVRADTKFYDPVALIIPTVFNPWTAPELTSFRGKEIRMSATGLRNHFPAGVWFFCHSTTDSSRYDILDLTRI